MYAKKTKLIYYNLLPEKNASYKKPIKKFKIC